MDPEPQEVNPANAILIYAWNELDEGGWLVPTLSEGDAVCRRSGLCWHPTLDRI